MREVTIEFDNFDCPSNNQVRSMNSWVYKKLVENLKTKILLQIGEGPWPKITFDKHEFPSHVRKQAQNQLDKLWVKRRFVYADITMRRPRRFDLDNSQGGAKPLWDAFTRMGWMVDDHCKWFHNIHRPQVIGDPKTVVTLYIPETDKDEKSLRERVNGK